MEPGRPKIDTALTRMELKSRFEKVVDFQGCGFSLGLGWVEIVGFGGMVGERFEKVVERRELNPTGLAARSYSSRLQP